MSQKIYCPLFQNANSDIADNPAVVWGRRRLSWKQLDLCVTSTVRQLKEFGFNYKNELRIGICADNSVESITFILACWRLGISVALLNTRNPIDMLCKQLQYLDLDGFVSDNSEILTGAGNAVKKRYMLLDCVTFDVMDSLYHSKEDSLLLSENLLATILFTSGSYLQPKAVCHSLQNHVSSAKLSNQRVAIESADSWLLSLPLYHVAGIGILMRCLFSGASIVIPGSLTLEESINKYKPTHLSLVPTQMQRLSDEVLKQRKAVLLGGAPISDFIRERIVSQNLNVYITYGMTETSSQIATSKLKKVDQGAELLSEVEAHLNSDNELLVKSETVCVGYWKDAQVLNVCNEEGYLATGDIAQIEGRVVKIVGRKDAMFISGGENIHPEEIEIVLLSIKNVQDVVVVAREDNEFGYRPVAFINALDSSVNKEYLYSVLVEKLPKYKIPDEIYCWPKDECLNSLKHSRQYFQNLLLEKSSLRML